MTLYEAYIQATEFVHQEDDAKSHTMLLF